MSNLILSFISIAIIAATAAAVIFFGGDAVRSGGLKAQHAKIVNEARQLELASQIYMNNNDGQMPSSEALDGRTLADFFYEGDGTSKVPQGYYLKAKPTGVSELASTTQYIWQYDGYINHPIADVEALACAYFNGQEGGSDKVEDIPLCSDGYDPRNPCCDS